MSERLLAHPPSSPQGLAVGTRLPRQGRAWRSSVVLWPGAAVLAFDLALRRNWGSFDLGHAGFYAASLAGSTLLWAALTHAACRRRGITRGVAAALLVATLGAVLGAQRYFHERYGVWLNLDLTLFGAGFLESVGNHLASDALHFLAVAAPFWALGVGLLVAARRWIRPRRTRARWSGRLAGPLLAAALFVPVHHRQQQAATPDLLALHALGGLLRSQLGLTDYAAQVTPRPRTPPTLPRIDGQPARPRNVLLVILESVRADVTCLDDDPTCRTTEHTRRATPERVPLRQLRALSSSTAISLAVLWTGLLPTEDRDTLHGWPVIFDYATAAGWDTAYWTSQNLLFGNSRLWVEGLAARHRFSATDLDPAAHIDLGAREELLVERCERELPTLQEPYLAVVHLANVHFPYRVEPDQPQPFEPHGTSKAPGDNPALMNHYRNAIWQQDRHLARLVTQLRATEAGRRTVVITTSDHGEAFREHGQMGHTFSLFDEEIRVPGWVAAPAETLSTPERAALAAHADAFTFHSDVTPTVLDLMGVLDEPRLRPFLARLPGRSWLRPPQAPVPLTATNCSGVWSCAFDNWGVLHGPLKLEGRAWDGLYRCWDVRLDPGETAERPRQECAALQPLIDRHFPRAPGAAP